VLPVFKRKCSGNQGVNIPIHPGNAPRHAVGTATAQITKDNHLYKAAICEFKMYMTIQAALKVQLVKAVPDTFLSKLCDDIL
jgi:hypothetical protein